MKKTIQSYGLIHVGLLVMAAGLYFFLIPADLAVGGVTGLAMVIQYFFKGVNLGVLMLAFNVILFGLAFIVIGRAFGGKTIYCSFLLSGIIGFFQWLLPLEGPIVDDLMMNLIFGILIQGIGMAIIFYENASTGGTDIVAKIINTFTRIPIGKALFLSDALITLGAGMVFGIELGLYAFLGILINGLIIDQVIAGLDKKVQVFVISEAFESINTYVKSELVRGSTVLTATGGYTNRQKNILNVILTKKEYMRLRHYIKEVDPNAFVTVSFVHEVFGEGFGLTG